MTFPFQVLRQFPLFAESICATSKERRSQVQPRPEAEVPAIVRKWRLFSVPAPIEIESSALIPRIASGISPRMDGLSPQWRKAREVVGLVHRKRQGSFLDNHPVLNESVTDADARALAAASYTTADQATLDASALGPREPPGTLSESKVPE